MSVLVKVDAGQVLVNARNVQRAIEGGTPKAAIDIGHELMRLSQREVPHDEGTLQNSGTVELMSNGDVVIGYHTPYAARLHEHPEYKFQKGRKGKYLEDPIINNRRNLGIRLVRNLGNIIDRGIMK